MVAAKHEEYWSAPIPSPDSMRKYEEVLSGSVDRILAMAERESATRQSIDMEAVVNDRKRVDAMRREIRRGQVLFTVISLAAFGVTAYCAYLGEAWVAGIFGCGTLASIGWAMLGGGGKTGT